ncbi:tripartite tricarboxylate transporter substrate binding protein [Cupriavidus malaysiensis]|nr:tripartite tricarboxylate transporter substrate binding protein [Cupriavidus malaysiensis]
MATTLNRRRACLGMVALLPLALAGLRGAPARAEAAWPARPIRLVLPFSAGGAGDTNTRLLAKALARQLGQSVIVDNKPGAGGLIGAELVARSAPDGYTLLVAGNGAVSNALLRARMPYADDALVPVASISSAPSVIVAAAGASFNDLKSLQAYAKARGGIAFGTAGLGSTGHFVAEMMRQALGVPVTVVHYKSGMETLNAVMGGQIDLASEAPVGVLGFVRGGKLRALAVADGHRTAVLPDVPTTVEQGFTAVRMQHWGGIYAPRGTPDAVLDRVAQATALAYRSDPDLLAQMAAYGYQPVSGSREGFARFLDDEKVRLGRLARAARMAAE